jgi:mannobiose 2-epimerase
MLGRFVTAGGSFARRVRSAVDLTRHTLRTRSPAPIFSGQLTADAVRREFSARRPILERVLLGNILAFWDQRVVDDEHGGYRLNHDHHGNWLGPSPKRLITQARVTWFYSRLANSAYATPDHLTMAGRGYEFMTRHLWDHDAGGFFWEVDPSGSVTVAEKHMMAQAFALHALAEYALASGDPQPIALAGNLFDLMTTRARDEVNGGYFESFDVDWNRREHGGGALDRDSAHKTLDTHLHLMEALTGYLRVDDTDEVRRQLEGLIEIMANATVDQRVAAGGEIFNADWSPVDSPLGRRVSYGHETERIWMLADACEAVGTPHEVFTDRYAAIFASVLTYGYDSGNGGYYTAGPLGRVARNRVKLWWPQAEGLLCCLVLYKLTGEPIYAQCFFHTLDWVIDRQVDWEYGEWHRRVLPDGTTDGIKAGPWKTPYHGGRAMIACLEGIDVDGEPPLPLRITR